MSFDIKEAAAKAAANRVEPRVNSRPYALSIETGVFLCLALLKLIVVFNTLLIRAEGTDPRKCNRISFVRCEFGEIYSKSSGRSESKGDPAGVDAEEAP